MTDRVIVLAIIGALLALIALAGSAMVWMAAVSGAEPTPAQDALITASDWTIKAAVGALLGFAGGAGLSRRNGVHQAG